MIEQFTAIKNRISASVTGVVTDLEVFESGNITLDIKLNDKLFVMAYFSNNKIIGVTEVNEMNEGLDMNFEYTTNDVVEAANHLFELLDVKTES